MENNAEVKKKRGRKKKEPDDLNITVSIEEPTTANVGENVTTTVKKRGRKPKGGKLILKNQENVEINNKYSNIILHLKCSMSDLDEHNNKYNKFVTDPLIYNPSVPPDIMTYNSIDAPTIYTNFISNDEEMASNEASTYAYTNIENAIQPVSQQILCQSCSETTDRIHIKKMDEYKMENEDDINMKDVNAKLKRIKLQLYKNTNHEKRSACFWCTYDFDNQPCYIPKYEVDGELCGYGSFCRPECAVAYLMKENIDDSTKFERYHLLNLVYSKVYNYKKNIKPAPNPYFLLEKYYGNLTIQEYRKLLKTEHMLLVIEKPMTRILPELHEDTEDFASNIYGSSNSVQQNKSGFYKVKRQSEKQKGPSKTAIMKDKFGF